MIPLNDTESNRYSTFPFMTVGLIALCTFIYLAEGMMAGDQGWEFLMRYAYIPSITLRGQGGGMLANITSMFLHANLLHLLGNMAALWVFGRRVEDACGPWRFLAFYLLAGTGANILYTIVQQGEILPGVGASGAIFGVMGAYLLLYPGGRILTCVIIIFFPIFPRIRAVWIVLYMVGVQIVPALGILLNNEEYSTNHWAHLGGFFSSVLILLFMRPAAFARYISDSQV